MQNKIKIFESKKVRTAWKAEKEDTDFIVLTKICAKFSRTPKWLNPKEAGPHFNNAAMAIIGKKAGKSLARYRNKNS